MKIPAILPWLTRQWRRMSLVAAGLLGLYALLGFLVLPRILKAQVPARLSRLLGREVSVERVRTNPFTLSVTLEGFRVKDLNGGTLLDWERLYVNWQLSSAFTGTQTFKAIELASPRGHLILMKDGRLSVADILERLSAPTAGSAPGEARPLDLAIGHLRVSRARLTLEDLTPAEPFTTTLGPLTMEVRGFRTVRDSQSPYALEGRTDAGERFAWRGTFTAEPLASQGTLELERLPLSRYRTYYREAAGFEVAQGLLSARAAYAFAWSEGRHELRLSDGQVDLEGLQITPRGGTEVPLDLPRAELRGLNADLLAPSIEIGTLTLQAPRIRLARLPDGQLDLVQLLTPRPAPDPAKPAKPLTLTLHALAVERASVDFEDRATPRPVTLAVRDANLRLEGFTLDPRRTSRLTASLALGDRGRLSAEGQLWPLRPALDLKVRIQDLDLPALDPYLEPDLDVRVNRGSVSAEGRLQAAFEGRPSDAMGFQGRLRLAGFEAMDGTGREPFLRYRELRLEGLDVRTAPRLLKVARVDLIEPENRLVVSPDGTTNVGRALKLGTPPSSAPTATMLPPTADRPFVINIQTITLARGRLSFIDRSLEPNAALMLTELEGRYEGLTMDPNTVSRVDITGKAGGLAPLRIQGRTMPLRRDQDTDVRITIQGAELSDFDPYARKYLGYTIRKGKSDLDMQVRIDRRQLDAVFKSRLDQFYLGDKVPGPDATRLPVKLGLAILRDRKGVIDIQLPVQGSLDDPDFRYGRLVWKAIGNLFTKILSAPFAWLGSLGGGGDKDLSFVSFEPGSAAPDAEARAKAQSLAKALAERPDLSLELEGTADPGADRSALQKAALQRLLVATKARAQKVDPEGVQVGPEDRGAWVKAAFESAFPAPKLEKGQVAPPPPPTAEMEQRLLGTLSVPDGELQQLADARAKAMGQLLREIQADPARLFEVTGGERARKEGGARVYFGLR